MDVGDAWTLLSLPDKGGFHTGYADDAGEEHWRLSRLGLASITFFPCCIRLTAAGAALKADLQALLGSAPPTDEALAAALARLHTRGARSSS